MSGSDEKRPFNVLFLCTGNWQRSGKSRCLRVYDGDAHEPHQHLREPAAPIARPVNVTKAAGVHWQDQGRRRQARFGRVMSEISPPLGRRLLAEGLGTAL